MNGENTENMSLWDKVKLQTLIHAVNSGDFGVAIEPSYTIKQPWMARIIMAKCMSRKSFTVATNPVVQSASSGAGLSGKEAISRVA